MKDPGTAIRKSFFDRLNGNVMWEGSPVPIVDEKLDVDITEHDVYVLMLDQVENDEATSVKTYFSAEINLRMQICNQRKTTNTKEVVENISDQIESLLYPSKTTSTLIIDAPFNLTYSIKTSGNYNPLIKNEIGFLISKILTFKNRITQQ